MTNRQRRFADEYVIDCNATRAYKAAYPHIKNDSSAAACGYKLLRNAQILAYITERLEELKSEKVADEQEVMEYLTSVLRGESEAEVVAIEMVGEGRSVPVRVKKSPDEKERLKAAELLGKRYGLYTDKLDQTVDADLNIVIDYGTEDTG